MTIKQLREATDDQLIQVHDDLAKNTVTGISYFLDELRRREAERAEAASYELSRRAYWLTIANSVLAAVSAIAAIVAILLAAKP